MEEKPQTLQTAEPPEPRTGRVTEFGERPDDADVTRRSFLKVAGFSIGTASLVACSRSPVEKAIPYLIQPEQIVPGKPYWMASVCTACPAGCGVLVKCRDGRPIKLEGNPDHPVSKGGLCAVGQASVLELYDSMRLRQPLRAGQPAGWAEVDRAIVAQLAKVKSGGGKIRFLTGTVNSPALAHSIDIFLSGFADGRRVSYDPLSASAIHDAHQRTHGVRAMPRYRFENAVAVVGIDADFLGTWISPVEHTAGYTSRRRARSPESFSWHFQAEPLMTLTGSKADERIALRPSDIRPLLASLTRRISQRSGEPFPGPVTDPIDPSRLDAIAARLWSARGASLVVCGTNGLEEQLLVNHINRLLGNYGSTIDLEQPSRQRTGSDAELSELVAELREGSVGALFVHGVNPLYDLPDAKALAELIRRVPLVVSFAERADETASAAHFVCPDHHFLESWSDSEAVDGTVAVVQPAISPLGGTRSVLESLDRWRGASRTMREIVSDTWREQIHPRSSATQGFEKFWDAALSNGFAEVRPSGAGAAGPSDATWRPDPAPVPRSKGLSLVLYPTVGMRDGRHGHNPWLYELPDPITKVTWDNYASVSASTAAELRVAPGDVVRIETSGGSIELPALIQPGQPDGVVAVALGYGRAGTERFNSVGPKWLFRREARKIGQPVGVNAAPLLQWSEGRIRYAREGVSVIRTGATFPLAATQIQNSLSVPASLAPAGGEVRPAVQEVPVAALLSREPGDKKHEEPSLWEKHPTPGHRWAMAIDLSACTGCSGCVISCQAENNIPVVGKDEVLREREMHWMRIDRYYAEKPDGSVDVVHQPMLCQHCENAGCETVCPVLATVHSSEGLNQQVYNRCVGTRYCANNCVYKVRRFNWFDYPHEDRLQNMVLNPDVTVRSRGVMEKCSMCIQRIEAARIESKRRGTPIADGEIRTACQQSCPAGAIVFGDINDPKSEIARARKDPRHYLVLEELGVRPSVGYLKVVRNRGEGNV